MARLTKHPSFSSPPAPQEQAQTQLFRRRFDFLSVRVGHVATFREKQQGLGRDIWIFPKCPASPAFRGFELLLAACFPTLVGDCDLHNDGRNKDVHICQKPFKGFLRPVYCWSVVVAKGAYGGEGGGGGEGLLERPSLCLHPIPASNTPTHQHTNTPTHKKRQQKQDPRRVSDHTTDRRLISVRVGYDAVFKERQRGFEFRYGRVGHQDQVQQTKTSSGKCGIGAALSTCKTGLTGLGT